MFKTFKDRNALGEFETVVFLGLRGCL